MRKRAALLVLPVAVATLLAGCGSDDDPTTATADDAATTTSVAPAAAEGTVNLVDTSLGEVLVDGDGMTLYLFTKDSDGKSACSGPCASTWPPLTVDGDPTAGAGVDEAELGTITRDDGSTQVTYHGKPLYTYAADSEPGDVTGQKVGGVWFAVTVDGQAVGEKAPATGGGY